MSDTRNSTLGCTGTDDKSLAVCYPAGSPAVCTNNHPSPHHPGLDSLALPPGSQEPNRVGHTYVRAEPYYLYKVWGCKSPYLQWHPLLSVKLGGGGGGGGGGGNLRRSSHSTKGSQQPQQFRYNQQAVNQGYNQACLQSC